MFYCADSLIQFPQAPREMTPCISPGYHRVYTETFGLSQNKVVKSITLRTVMLNFHFLIHRRFKPQITPNSMTEMPAGLVYGRLGYFMG